MSKRFTSKTCVYCGRPSATGDHVFARAFFLPSERADLPKVPACRTCNARKSELERELCAIVPFGGRQPRSLEALTTLVPRRLARNQRLHRKLQAETSQMWVPQASGLVMRCMSVPFPGDKLIDLFAFIVRGVHAHHFGMPLKPDTFVDVQPLMTPELRAAYRGMLGWKAASRVHQELGGGTFEYEGLLGIDNSQISVWAFEMFGGMQVAAGGSGPVQRLILGAMAGPRKIEENAERTLRWRQGRGTERPFSAQLTRQS